MGFNNSLPLLIYEKECKDMGHGIWDMRSTVSDDSASSSGCTASYILGSEVFEIFFYLICLFYCCEKTL